MENKDNVVTIGILEESMKRLKTELTAEIATAMAAAITGAVDRLAYLINKSFIDIEKRMATKEDLRVLERKVDNIDMHLSAYVTQWNKEFESLREWTEEHEGRLKVLEREQPA